MEIKLIFQEDQKEMSIKLSFHSFFFFFDSLKYQLVEYPFQMFK